MATATDNDPFLQVQAELLSALETTRPLFSSFLRIRSTASSSTSPELTQARGELEVTLRDLNLDLGDLRDSVRAVEPDPFRYGLDTEEVVRRRHLVDEVDAEITNMQAELEKPTLAKGASANGGAYLPDPSAFEGEGDGAPGNDYAAYEEQRQTEMMHEQDQALDGVFVTVGNLREQADVMGRELEEQGEMLGDVENLADRVGGKLSGGMKKINTIIRKNEDRWSGCCIGVLIFVLILLLIIVIAI